MRSARGFPGIEKSFVVIVSRRKDEEDEKRRTTSIDSVLVGDTSDSAVSED